MSSTQLTNSPDDETTTRDLQEFYGADAAKTYNEMMADEMPKVECDLELLIKALLDEKQGGDDDEGGGTILDVCCGTGDYLLWLSKQQSEDVRSFTLRGMDLSQDMLQLARDKLSSSSPAIELNQGTMENLQDSIPDESCAAVLCNFSIHHLKDCRKVFQEAYRVLKPNTGLYYLSFWEQGGQDEKIEQKQEQPDGATVTTYHHNHLELKKMLGDVGFLVVGRDTLSYREVKEEIYPGFSMNAAYLLVRKRGS